MCKADDNSNRCSEYQSFITVEKVISRSVKIVDNSRLTVQIYNKKSPLSRGFGKFLNDFPTLERATYSLRRCCGGKKFHFF